MAKKNPNTKDKVRIESRILFIKGNLEDLIEAQDGLRGIGYSLHNEDAHISHIESMGFAVAAMATNIQNLTNSIENNFSTLLEEIGCGGSV